MEALYRLHQGQRNLRRGPYQVCVHKIVFNCNFAVILAAKFQNSLLFSDPAPALGRLLTTMAGKAKTGG